MGALQFFVAVLLVYLAELALELGAIKNPKLKVLVRVFIMITASHASNLVATLQMHGQL